MEKFPKYPHIENVAHVKDIFQYKCVVTEKIHGSNFRMMWDEKDGMILGSRENIIYKNQTQHGSLYDSIDWILKNNTEEKIKKYPGYVFYGEYFGTGVQKGISYCETKDLRIFDIRNPEGELLDFSRVTEICNEIGLKLVPVVYEGLITVDWLQSIRDNLSVVGKEAGFDSDTNTWEGVVIKPSRMTRDRHGEWLMAKYKSEKWAERAKQPKPQDIDPAAVELKQKADEFAKSVCTPGRLANIIEHLQRTGNTELKMSRTGEFLKEFVSDVMETERDTYSSLDKADKNVYNKAVNALASAMWKEHVMNLE